MSFTPKWNQSKLATIPTDTELIGLRADKSNTALKKAGLRPEDILYKKQNNALREADSVFLSFFNETNVRNAVQRGQASFKKDADATDLLAVMIGTTEVAVVDQGTHQAEDRTGGGFKLHFDVRRPSDSKCFHFYVGQDSYGVLDITEISYMDGSTSKSVVSI